MMEAFTTIQIISSIVQLVDFSSKCVAKGVELYRSADGILDENAAIEIAATYLTGLNDQVRNAAFSATHQQLRDLCDRISAASSELLHVIVGLKVQGTKTKCKSMRKAIKSVWGKAKVQELEQRLNSLRDELNLHISVVTRQQVESLHTQVASRFDDCDAQTKSILDAILDNRDVFQNNLSDHSVLVRDSLAKTRSLIQQNHETTRIEIQQSTVHVEQRSREEHAITRQNIQNEGDRVIVSNKDAARTVARTVELAEVSLQDTLESNAETNTLQHNLTQSQIAELKDALRQLSAQIEARDRQLEDLLADLSKTKSEKKRKMLREQSNAVTAAIFALKIMYCRFLEILEALQSRVGDYLQKSQALRVLWYNKLPSSASVAIEMQRPKHDLSNPNGARPTHVPAVTYIHGDYYALLLDHSYEWMGKHSILVDPEKMEEMWPFPQDRRETVDMQYCLKSPYWESIWLFAATNAAIIRTIAPGTASLDLILNIFKRLTADHVYHAGVDRPDYAGGKWPNPASHSTTPKERSCARLKSDIEYLTAFAELRGILSRRDSVNCPTCLIEADSDAEPETCRKGIFNLNNLKHLELEDLRNLLQWLIGFPDITRWTQGTCTLFLESEGPAACMARLLMSMGLRMKVIELEIRGPDPRPKVVVQYAGYDSQRNGLDSASVIETGYERFPRELQRQQDRPDNSCLFPTYYRFHCIGPQDVYTVPRSGDLIYLEE